MKGKRNIACLAGGAAVAGLSLGGLWAMGPLDSRATAPGFLLHSALLILFWFGYVTCMICGLCWLGCRIFGAGTTPDPRQQPIED